MKNGQSKQAPVLTNSANYITTKYPESFPQSVEDIRVMMATTYAELLALNPTVKPLNHAAASIVVDQLTTQAKQNQ